MQAVSPLLPLLLAVWAGAAPAAQRTVVLFLGDSLTAGYGLAPEEAYPALLEKRWRERGSPWRARNAGVSGATTAGILESLDWSLAPDVGVVFLAVGANDGLRGLSLSQTRRNLDAIVERSRAGGRRVVLAGMKLPPNYGPEYTRAFEKLYADLSRRRKLERLPFLLEGVAGRPELNLEDGIHPNAEGHKVIAALVDRFLAAEKVVP